jgi:hypothetical protein
MNFPSSTPLLSVCAAGGRVKTNSHIPYRSDAMPLRVQILSFPFDLHTAAVLDSHMSCRARAMPRQ